MTADAWAGVIVLAGGLLVFVGSLAQAWGDLRKYGDLLVIGKETIGTITTIARVADGSGQRFSALRIAVLPLIALWRGKSVELTDQTLASPDTDAGRDRMTAAKDLQERAEQALNDAAGWSLILVGSLAAVIAAAFQLYVLTRH